MFPVHLGMNNWMLGNYIEPVRLLLISHLGVCMYFVHNCFTSYAYDMDDLVIRYV